MKEEEIECDTALLGVVMQPTFHRVVVANTNFRMRVGAEFGIRPGGSSGSRASFRAVALASPRFLCEGQPRVEHDIRIGIHSRENARELQSEKEQEARILSKQMARLASRVRK